MRSSPGRRPRLPDDRGHRSLRGQARPVRGPARRSGSDRSGRPAAVIPVSEPVLGEPRRPICRRVSRHRLDLVDRPLHRRVRGRLGRRTAAAGTASRSPTGRSPCSWRSRPWASARATRSSCRRSRSSRARWRSLRRGDAGPRRRRPRDLVHGRRPGRGEDHRRTRAIMPVHIYGHPVDMDPSSAWPRRTAWPSSRTPRRRTAPSTCCAGDDGERLAAMRQLRRGQLLQLLRQQARHHGRRRHGPDRRRAARRAPAPLRNLAFEPERRFLHHESSGSTSASRTSRRPSGSHRSSRSTRRSRASGRSVRRTRQGFAARRRPAPGRARLGQERLLDERPRPRSARPASTPRPSPTACAAQGGDAAVLPRHAPAARPPGARPLRWRVVPRRGRARRPGPLPALRGRALTDDADRHVSSRRRRRRSHDGRRSGSSTRTPTTCSMQTRTTTPSATSSSGIFTESGRPVRTVLDLGCGTGAHAVRLAQRGYEVVGVDVSEDMLRFAERAERRRCRGRRQLRPRRCALGPTSPARSTR